VIILNEPDHGEPAKTPWISDLLPRQRFAEVCQRVFFAIDDHSQIEWLLANGYLAYTFFEHFAISGRHDSLEYTQRCRANLQSGMERLPLILPTDIETVAALTLGVRSLRATLAMEQSLTWPGLQHHRKL
jgi:hypothetical protein